MGFIGGRAEVVTTVKLSGTIPAPGNAPANALSNPTNTQTESTSQALTYGTSEGKIDVPCAGEYLIAAGGSLTLNLYDGGTTTSDLTTLFGAAANLRDVKSLTVSVVSGGDASGVAVGAAGSNIFAGFFGNSSDIVNIYPDGPALALGKPAGVAVTSSAKNLKLANNGASEVVVRVTAAGTTVVAGMWTGFWGFLTY